MIINYIILFTVISLPFFIFINFLYVKVTHKDAKVPHKDVKVTHKDTKVTHKDVKVINNFLSMNECDHLINLSE